MHKSKITFLLLILFVVTLGTLVAALRAQTAGRQPAAAQAQESHSVWDGIYTKEQAQRGEALFHKQCSLCHGDNLLGKPSEDTPALAGPTFQKAWNNRPLGELFKKIIRKMPQDDPGTLTPQQTADLVAFILSSNQFPAGQAELPLDAERLANIPIDVKKPEAKN